MTTRPNEHPFAMAGYLPHLMLCAAMMIAPAVGAAEPPTSVASVAEQAPAAPAAAAEPAAPAQPTPPTRPQTRPTPARNIRVTVSVTPANAAQAQSPQVLTVVTADGRRALIRHQSESDKRFFSVDAYPTLVGDKSVLLELKLQSVFELQGDGGSPQGAGKLHLNEELAVVLVPGVTQRVTQVDDKEAGRSINVDVTVELVK